MAAERNLKEPPDYYRGHFALVGIVDVSGQRVNVLRRLRRLTTDLNGGRSRGFFESSTTTIGMKKSWRTNAPYSRCRPTFNLQNTIETARSAHSHFRPDRNTTLAGQRVFSKQTLQAQYPLFSFLRQFSSCCKLNSYCRANYSYY